MAVCYKQELALARKHAKNPEFLAHLCACALRDEALSANSPEQWAVMHALADSLEARAPLFAPRCTRYEYEYFRGIVRAVRETLVALGCIPREIAELLHGIANAERNWFEPLKQRPYLVNWAIGRSQPKTTKKEEACQAQNSLRSRTARSKQ